MELQTATYNICSPTIPTALFSSITEIENAVPYNIDPLNEEKRLRVYENQLLDTMLENSKTLHGFWFNLVLYEKARDKLVQRFPHRAEEIQAINVGFLAKMQFLFKILTKRICIV